MELKYIGLAAVLAIALYVAVLIKKFGENRTGFYSALYDFITYIKNQIEFFCTPTEEIINSYCDNFLTECGFLSRIEGNEWESAIEHCKYIDNTCKELLLNFSKKLGRSAKEEQIANCDYALAAIEKQIERSRADVIGKYKAYSSLAVIFGFMIVILLI